MITALWLMAAQGVIGAFDTLYYHEWRARLPARGREASPELKLHAARDLLYGILFGTLPWFAWQGRSVPYRERLADEHSQPRRHSGGHL